jgi:Ca-activated chloride channel family protein
MKPALIALSALLLLPQQTFRSGVNVVAVYATVVDRGGRFVPDLTAADFEVADNGRLQPITVFESGTLPIRMALMVDESPSVVASSDRMIDAVREFAKGFLPGDRATIGAFSHTIRLSPRLSDSPASGLAGLWLGRPRFPSGTALWDALDAARDVLKNETGRRVILVLTDADDNCSMLLAEDVIPRLERDGTMVYAIGVKGTGGLPVRELRDVTRDSGGYYFELKNDDDLAATFRRVADELHRQYLIGFVPQAVDGKSHQLEVRTKRSGMTVRSRRSYVAALDGRGGR